MAARIPNLTINLRFPPPPGGATGTFNASTPFSGNPEHQPRSAFKYESSKNFKLLTEIVEQINLMKKDKEIEVIIDVQGTLTTPLNKWHLHHLLPFYDLLEENWVAKWQTFPSEDALEMRANSWMILYLDGQRERLEDRRQRSAATQQARQEREAAAREAESRKRYPVGPPRPSADPVPHKF